MRVLGVNALFHDPAAALVIDGVTVAAAEEERFSRRKHGKRPVPFAAWELPELAARWCLEQAGLTPADLDAVAYSYDPELARPAEAMSLDDPWDHLRQEYARRAPEFLAEALPGLKPERVRFVAHHVAHGASAGLASPHDDSAVLVLDGRGECASHLAGVYAGGELKVLAAQELPHSLGLFYEELTDHLGFLRSSDEYKVMALASYGTPRFREQLREYVHADGTGGYVAHHVPWERMVARRLPGRRITSDHADLAASAQLCLEDMTLDLGRWLHEKTGRRTLAMAGGVALNCVANTRLYREGPYEDIFVQPAAGDAGTALGAALHVAQEQEAAPVSPMPTAALGRGWSDEALRAVLEEAAVPYEEPEDIAETVAETLAGNGIVAWYQGRSEFGPRALGHRSLLAHPGHPDNLERLNAVKGREEFRPVAPMVLAERAAELFEGGPLPSPYMLFVHHVREPWRTKIPAVVHVDGTARVQTVEEATEPLVARMLTAFDRRTGIPVVVNTSLNTAGRPMVDSPREALECFGSAPIDLLAIGPFAVRRGRAFA
ncbi:carbamoyltransferase family protein [Streptomyces olivaceiscleroticus]|uniref:Carbamoyltransferase C-terminal domain-containing protein n=1 Tax=Streptomyces olivaceiscleroticus TaxID=68245 RepID=A0ABN1A4J3_9ACTN